MELYVMESMRTLKNLRQNLNCRRTIDKGRKHKQDNLLRNSGKNTLIFSVVKHKTQNFVGLIFYEIALCLNNYSCVCHEFFHGRKLMADTTEWNDIENKNQQKGILWDIKINIIKGIYNSK